MVAKYTIKDTFIITGRGLVLSGKIEEGEVRPGDFIEFNAFNKTRKRRITGVDFMRKAEDKEFNVGLLIKCENEDEILELRKWRPQTEIAIITQE
jgi:translation elongation factor EF-Tu-like GTPase